MKALISALALLSFVGATTIPLYTAAAQTETTTQTPAKKAPAKKKSASKKKTSKKKTASKKKKAPAKSQTAS